MSAYFDYLKAMLSNIGGIFTGEFPSAENSTLSTYAGDFGVTGWVLYVIFLLLLIALVAGLVLLVIYLVKKLIAKKAKGATEQKMLEEIERLNLELYDMSREKDKLLNLKREADGIPTGLASGEEGEEKKEKTEIKGGPRFQKLNVVDSHYKDGQYEVALPEENQNITLKEICERFRNFACSQMRLYYTPETVRQFFSAMGTGKLIILEGISGTGKTSLPYCMGRFLKHSAAICAVQPNWRDRSELLGYYNDFTKKFTETEFLRAVYEATFRNDISIIVLDEMNLARIEYYFAEFLSIMEMPRPEEWIVDVIAAGRDDDPVHLKEGKLLIPQNIWFIGTANNDDSTFTITDKVYDRATSLFFENKSKAFDAPYTEGLAIPADYLNNLYAEAKKAHPMSEETLENFAALDEFVIENFKLAFGNRVMKQIQGFVPCYIACGGTELEALDFIFKTKILKKFEVLNVSYLKDELIKLDEELTRLFGMNEFPLSREKIRRFIKMAK
jgi:hypothetical protein